jgi:hypothetical protein
VPRYFFNVILDNNRVPDPDGKDLPDPDAAWEAARRAAVELMRAPTQQAVNWLLCRFEVRDEAGEIVLEFPFVEAIGNKGPLH